MDTHCVDENIKTEQLGNKAGRFPFMLLAGQDGQDQDLVKGNSRLGREGGQSVRNKVWVTLSPPHSSWWLCSFHAWEVDTELILLTTLPSGCCSQSTDEDAVTNKVSNHMAG